MDRISPWADYLRSSTLQIRDADPVMKVLLICQDCRGGSLSRKQAFSLVHEVSLP